MSENTENVLASPGSKGLVERAKDILMSPKTEWPIIAAEEPDPGKLITGYAVPLLLISGIATFIGYGFLGVGLVGAGTLTWGIAQALIVVVGGLIGVYLAAAVINALAGTFGSKGDFNRALQLVVYASTASWVAGFFAFIPILGALIALFGLYGIYLFYLGLPHMMQTPKDKVIPYMLVSAVVMVVVYFVIAAIMSMILLPIFGLSAIGSSMF